MTNRLMLVFVGFSTLLFLGLAALGAGGAMAFFSRPAFIAASAITFALTIASVFSEGHLGAGVREDRGNRWVIPVFGALSVLDAFLPARTDKRRGGSAERAFRRAIRGLSRAHGAARAWTLLILRTLARRGSSAPRRFPRAIFRAMSSAPRGQP